MTPSICSSIFPTSVSRRRSRSTTQGLPPQPRADLTLVLRLVWATTEVARALSRLSLLCGSCRIAALRGWSEVTARWSRRAERYLGGRWAAAKRATASAFRAAGLPSAEGRERRGRGRESGRRGVCSRRTYEAAVAACREEFAGSQIEGSALGVAVTRMFVLDPTTRATASAIGLLALCGDRHYRAVEMSLTPRGDPRAGTLSRR